MKDGKLFLLIILAISSTNSIHAKMNYFECNVTLLSEGSFRGGTLLDTNDLKIQKGFSRGYKGIGGGDPEIEVIFKNHGISKKFTSMGIRLGSKQVVQHYTIYKWEEKGIHLCNSKNGCKHPAVEAKARGLLKEEIRKEIYAPEVDGNVMNTAIDTIANIFKVFAVECGEKYDVNKLPADAIKVQK